MDYGDYRQPQTARSKSRASWALYSGKKYTESTGVYGDDPSPSLILLAIGICSYIWVPFGARVYVSELLISVALLFLLVRRPSILRSKRVVITFLALTGVWFTAQLTSDVINSIPVSIMRRESLSILLFAADFVVIAVYTNRKVVNAYWLLVGLTASALIRNFISPSEYMIEEPWKFGYALPVTLGSALLFSRSSLYKVAPLGLGCLAVLHLVMGSRGQAVVCSVSAVLSLVSIAHNSRRNRVSVIALICAAICAIFCCSWIYGHMANSGYLGEAAEQKYLKQSSGRLGLLGGRPEIVFSYHAIVESPLVGAGSRPKQNIDVMTNSMTSLNRLGYSLYEYNLAGGGIPTHSHLFGSWVSAGLFGILIWLWILKLSVRYVAQSVLFPSKYTPVVCVLGVLLIWDVLFSPFGEMRRVMVSVSLVAMHAMYADHLSQKGSSDEG